MTSVSIREVAPRDGLQNEEPIPTDAKVRLIDALSGTGVRRIEAVSFVHPKAIPQMADADEVWRRAGKADGVRYSALVPNSRGAARALAAGFTEVEVVVSASDTHNRRNVNRSTVTIKEVRTLDGKGKEMTVDRTLMVQHGYQMRGAKNYSSGKDVFVRAAAR